MGDSREGQKVSPGYRPFMQSKRRCFSTRSRESPGNTRLLRSDCHEGGLPVSFCKRKKNFLQNRAAIFTRAPSAVVESARPPTRLRPFRKTGSNTRLSLIALNRLDWDLDTRSERVRAHGRVARGRDRSASRTECTGVRQFVLEWELQTRCIAHTATSRTPGRTVPFFLRAA